MSTQSIEHDPKYPVGKFTPPDVYTPELRAEAIAAIAALPKKMRAATEGLSDTQLDTPYREGGWTVRQVVHHVADSHAQALGRLQFPLTEEFPAVPGYKQNLWAELENARTTSVESSLSILDGVHARWAIQLRALDEAQWQQRGITHVTRGQMPNDHLAQLYAWHCQHHTAHITNLRKQMGW